MEKQPTTTPTATLEHNPDTPTRAQLLAETKAVSDYLATLSETPVTNGNGHHYTRKPSAAKLQQQLVRAQQAAQKATDPLDKLKLSQKTLDIKERIKQLYPNGSTVSFDDNLLKQQGFVKHAKSFSERKGITWKAFRQMKVPPKVLREAGIARS